MPGPRLPVSVPPAQSNLYHARLLPADGTTGPRGGARPLREVPGGRDEPLAHRPHLEAIQLYEHPAASSLPRSAWGCQGSTLANPSTLPSVTNEYLALEEATDNPREAVRLEDPDPEL
jgi:hypothetical protein